MAKVPVEIQIVLQKENVITLHFGRLLKGEIGTPGLPFLTVWALALIDLDVQWFPVPVGFSEISQGQLAHFVPFGAGNHDGANSQTFDCCRSAGHRPGAFAAALGSGRVRDRRSVAGLCSPIEIIPSLAVPKAPQLGRILPALL